MNTMTNALQSAGVKLPPQNQRCWQWLKDNGPHTAKQIAAALKLPLGNVGQHLSNMYVRGMIERTRANDPRENTRVMVYSAVGNTYELLPVKRQPKPAQSTRSALPPTVPEKATFGPVDATLPQPTGLCVTALRLPKHTVQTLSAHAADFNITFNDVVVLALETYAKQMGVPLAPSDPMSLLRRKLNGGA